MWEEIDINDKTGIDELTDLWNNRLGCIAQLSKDVIENTLLNKRDSHYYLFKGTYVKMLIGLKHDISDDTTYIFNVSSDTYVTEIDNAKKSSEMWDAYQLIIKLLLTKFKRKVKLIKWEKSIRLRSIIDSAVGFYAIYGIKAMNFEHHWLFELM